MRIFKMTLTALALMALAAALTLSVAAAATSVPSAAQPESFDCQLSEEGLVDEPCEVVKRR